MLNCRAYAHTENSTGLILGILLVASVIYINLKNAKSFKVKNPICIILVGLALGFIASFFGVGGGPINVHFLLFSSQ